MQRVRGLYRVDTHDGGPEPVFIVEEDGGRERFITDEGEVVAGRRALPEEEGPACAVGFVPHWKTCPAADRFRRR